MRHKYKIGLSVFAYFGSNYSYYGYGKIIKYHQLLKSNEHLISPVVIYNSNDQIVDNGGLPLDIGSSVPMYYGNRWAYKANIRVLDFKP